MPTETIFCHAVKAICPKTITETLCPKEIISSGTCWNCHAKIPFRIPRRGYTNDSGRCISCGANYTMMSNYGLVTIFPLGVVEDYAAELLKRVCGGQR